MIGLITGKVEHIAVDYVVVDVGGVGYEVFCHTAALATLSGVGAHARFYTDLEVRPESMRLFGFTDLAERAWFRLLKSVPGVGAKGALAMLGAVGGAGLADAIAMGDSVPLRRASGIGAKLAARVVQELKGRAPDLAETAMSATGLTRSVRGQILSALTNHGIPHQEAAQVVQQVMEKDGEEGKEDEDFTDEDLKNAILRAFQIWGRNRV